MILFPPEARLPGIQEDINKEDSALKASQTFITLSNGKRLPYHVPHRSQNLELALADFLPEESEGLELEVEIGPGKGEFLAARSQARPDRFLIGIDRRKDRVELSERKLQRSLSGRGIVIREDACSFAVDKIPPLAVLHLYQPDPWPKRKHHKNRFFRSPEALAFAKAVRPGGELRLSTDHIAYFYEMIERVRSWDLFETSLIIEKQAHMSEANSHFEKIFLRKNMPVFKASFVRRL